MEKFFSENYRKSVRDIKELFRMLDDLNLSTDFHESPSADALLTAAVEMWKHQNPWIQIEYGESDQF